MNPAGTDTEPGPDRPVLLCYDGSDDAGEAIEQAPDLVGRGPALVVHAWRPPSSLLFSGKLLARPHPLAEAAEEFDSAAAEEAEALVARGVEIAHGAGFEPEPLSVRAGPYIWSELVRVASERDVRVIVLASHGRSSRTSALLGSVTSGVTGHADRPVLVIPTRQADPSTPGE